MQHHWFADVSSVPFLVTETEAEMVTEGFGIVLRLD